jgi:gluconate 2-dehydrogenase gamma chain
MKPKRRIVSITRRQFVTVGAMASAALAAGCASHRRGPWEFLSKDNARTLAAVCDQIIPADDFPSASQAGVVTYIDRQLTRHYRPHQDAYETGLGQADQLSMNHYGVHLADASPQQQLATVITVEQQCRKFFEMVRTHTEEGYYGSPRHGGNRDAVSWRMLGLAEPPVRGRAQYDFTKSPQS